ncbi:Uncharacterised protein [Paenibacillus polymyxa]|uniref:Uncharacterized protein n=1 Tax=Paenibacillus polymyxa TaxID=1406 RepID=A0A378XUX6_PAEPO|nr:Uncharacterised protein [Paenibacillus polymyxa]
MVGGWWALRVQIVLPNASLLQNNSARSAGNRQ